MAKKDSYVEALLVCKHCSGTGHIPVRKQARDGVPAAWLTCPACHGRNKLEES